MREGDSWAAGGNGAIAPSGEKRRARPDTRNRQTRLPSCSGVKGGEGGWKGGAGAAVAGRGRVSMRSKAGLGVKEEVVELVGGWQLTRGCRGVVLVVGGDRDVRGKVFYLNLKQNICIYTGKQSANID